MSKNTTLTDIAISNEHSLKRLIRAIALSFDQFSLILVRCNYTELCKQVLDNIRSQTKDVNLREVFLSPSTKALHNTIVSELFLDIPAVKTDCLPTAVMVFGLESVTNLEDVLSGINQARDIYADTFSFPIVLWLKDEVGTSLSRFAPDFKSWAATTIKFEMAAPDLVTLIEQQTQSLFDKVIEAGAQKFLSNEALLLDPKSQQRREIESARNDLLRLYEIKLEAQLEASLEFVLGRDNYVNDNIDKALLHYQRSLELWEEEIKSNSVSLIGKREQGVGNRQQGVGNGQQGIGNGQQGIGNGQQGVGNGQQGVGNGQQGVGNGQQGVGNGQQGVGNSQQGVGNSQQEFSPPLPLSPSPPLPLPSLIRQAVVMFHLGLCYRRLADLQPAANISFWQNALNWFKQCLDIFETINRKDLSAKFIYPACEVLQRLEQWDDLSELATYSLELHQSFNNKTLVAQDYGFLCVVAASKSDWVKAHELASTALSIAEEVPEVSRSSESWYLLLLGRTLRNLSEWDEAVNTLEWAKVVCEAQYEPSLYLEIVEELRSLYFNERHDYLEAFKLKREKIQIEHQYGFRAFIGASQLQPQRYRINPVLQPQKISSTPDQVAQEIAASGRQRDVHHLLEKMTRADCKLTVVHGPSGVGKSSIIKAGLVPALKQNAIGERMALPIVLSVYTDWITALGRSLNQVIARTSISLAIEITVDVILEKLKLLADNNYTIILIFDQLEEFFFVKQDTAQRIEFYKFFNKCLNIPFVKVILSLREDYLHYLLEFERLSYLETNDSYNLGVINKNILDKNIRYYLGKFTCQDANSIIHSLTERSHYQLSEELIDKLVEDLAAETYQVHPIELQIVGAQLETENITTLGEYQRSGGSEKLVQNWLEKVIYDCGQENEELSWKLLFELTDEKGTRPLKTKAELVTAIFTEEDAYDSEGNTQTDNLLIDINQNIDSAFSKALKQPKKQYEVGNNKEIEEDFMHSYNVSTLELILEILVGSGLVLRVLQESGERYQLVHDYLVKPIRVRNDYGIVAELEKIRFEKTKAEVAQKLSQKKLNLILQKRLREARLAGFALAVMSTTIGGLWWQADLQKKAAMSQSLRAERSENNFKIGALTAASEALFASNKEFDALVESLRAWRKIKSGHGIQPDTKMRVVTALQQAVYGVTEVNRLEGHKDIVWDVNFSPDGKLLASGSRDKSVKIWRTDGSLLQTLKAHNESITSLTFSSDGSLLASASRDNTVKIWRKNPTTGKFYSQPVTTLDHPDWVDKVSFSPDGNLLVTGSKDQTVRIWRSDGKLLKTLEGHQGWINWVTFSPDGQFIASASDDNTVKIWSRDGALLTTLPGHEEGITVVNFSPDGKKLASAGRNGIVKLWQREQKDGETGFTYRAYKNLEQHKGIVWSLNFDSEGKKLASAGDDNTINLIDVSSGKLLKTLKGHSDAVVSVSFSPDNKLLASASYDKSVKLWSLNPPKLPVLEGHSDRVLSVAWSPDGKILASSSRDNTVKLWQREPKNTGFDTRLYKTLLGHTDKVASVSFHPDGEILASASYDKTIKLWQRDGKLIKTLKGHNDSVTSISFSGDGKLLASASKDKTVKLWNLKGKLVKTLKGHQGRVNSVRFSTDKHSQALASGSDDQTVKLWQRDGVLLKTFLPHSGWVLGVSFSPSDNLLASASWDNTVRLWRWDGTLLKTLLKGYGDSVSNVTFSPNGEILAAASWDSTVKLWSTEGKLIKTLNEHQAPVLDVSFSPDGQTLASASDDNTIVLWNLDLKNLLVKGCHWVGDYLKYNRNVENRDRNLCQGIS